MCPITFNGDYKTTIKFQIQKYLSQNNPNRIARSTDIVSRGQMGLKGILGVKGSFNEEL